MIFLSHNGVEVEFLGLPDKSEHEEKQSGKVFFGWWTVLATGIMAAWSWGSWTYGFGSYFKPLYEEFGWSRAQLSVAHSMGRLEGGMEGLFGGYLTDKYGPRLVNLVGMVVAGLGLCLMYFLNDLLSFIIVWGFIVSLGFNLGSLGPLETAIANWFVRKRGLAIGIERFIAAAGGGFLVQFMSFLLYALGWRMAFLVAGIVTIVISVPLTWYWVKPHRPEYYGLMPDGVTVKDNPTKTDAMIKAGAEYAGAVGEVEFTLRQLLKTMSFWIITITSMCFSLTWAIISVHQIPHLTDMGIDPVAAAVALGLMVIISAPGRIVGGVLADRCHINHMKYLIMIPSFIQCLALFIFMRATTIEMVYLFTVLFGVAMGIRFTLTPLIRGRFFGRKAFALAQGTSALITLPTSIIAPIYVGWVYDVTGSYMSVFIQALVILFIGSVILFFLKPPKPPEKRGKITELI